MIDLIKDNHAQINEICRHNGVSKLEVFGSAARSDFDPTTSDLDFLIEFLEFGPGIATRYIGFISSMEALLGKRVDTIFGPKVKNPILQEDIDRHRELVYESPVKLSGNIDQTSDASSV